ncbi:ATP-binding protein [Oscillochloris sp. ZM17-4]|uniref:tetratricopeptide repeat protein n=1 Tax=Oscillochloris sp. ZM17-4 TaxID=2866714 RepID=UPI001C73DB53|nr:tetratricopeptide repeat protein [Oscillochloris sp. ZM17-4]MBX0328223.1 ATP-binding protein [Oscillochloris sp. ZM17-4]
MTFFDATGTGFVGRTEEIQRALKLLDPAQPVWMFHFVGDGGIGKTKLLEVLGPEFEQLGCVVPALIDIYDFANQTQDGLINSLTRQLGSEHFTTFLARQDQEPATSEEAYENEQELIAAFVADYNALARTVTKIVLRFDTLENIPHQSFATWLLERFLPSLHGQTIVLTAGREPIPPAYLGGHIDQRWLTGITREDARTYMQQRFASEHLPELIDQASLDKIYDLAEGRPILLALALGWILLNADVDELIAVPKEDFEREMVSWVRELPSQVNAAILHMAVVYKRCDAPMLAHLMGLTPAEAEHVLAQLQNLAFIKYRADLHEYTLHDEMRYLIGKYAAYPPATRRVIARKAVEAYQEKLARVTDTLERRTLEIEELYYELNSDLDIGQVLFKAITLFNDYGRKKAVDFCRLMLEVIEANVAKLTAEQFDQLEISRARLAFYRHDDAQARHILDILNRQEQVSSEVRYEIYNLIGSIEERSDLKRALEYQHKSRSVLEQLLGQIDPTSPAWASRQSDLAQIYRKIATLSTTLGEYDQARSWNTRSLGIEKAMMNDAGVAACMNNIANLDRQRGEYGRAREEALQALKLRQNLKEEQQQQVGFSWSTIGMIERDAGNYDLAVHYFYLASQVFEHFKDEVENAKALANLATIYHWREVSLTVKAAQIFDPNSVANDRIPTAGPIHLELEHYLRQEWPSFFLKFRMGNSDLKKRAEQSAAYLEHSERILRRRNRKADLARTLNYKGRLWLHRSEWWKAEDSFEESRRLAAVVGAEPLVVDGLVSLILTHYLKNTTDAVVPLSEEVEHCALPQGQRYAELLSRMELILGNIAFELATSTPSQQHYRRAIAHYGEACAQALLFNRSNFEAARYVLRDRLQRIQPEFIDMLCTYLIDFWRNDSRDLLKHDTSLLDTLHDVRRRKLSEQDV